MTAMEKDTTQLVYEAMVKESRPPSNTQILRYVRAHGRPISLNSVAYHIRKLKKEGKINRARMPVGEAPE